MLQSVFVAAILVCLFVPRAAADYGNLPLAFERNIGQADGSVDFLARSHGYNVLLSRREAVFSMRSHGATTSVVRMRLTGVRESSAAAEGVDPLAGKSHYLIGTDVSKWQRDVPQFRAVKYTGVYRDIDLIYYGNQRELEYDFVVHPGADASRIRLSFDGVDNIAVDKNGDLVLYTSTGESRHRKPLIYQNVGGLRVEVPGGYTLRGNHVGFNITGAYNRQLPLVIDPVLMYSTYLGGTGEDSGKGIAVDAAGNAYIIGYTRSLDFSTTAGSYRATSLAADASDDGANDDIFVTKLNPAGTAIIFSTYIGGAKLDQGHHIFVDAGGAVYGVGASRGNFPTTAGAYSSNTFGIVAFKLNPAGNQLLFATGVPGLEIAFVSPVQGSPPVLPVAAAFGGDTLFVAGWPTSAFVATPGAYRVTQPTAGFSDIALVRLSADGSSRIFGTFLGGAFDDLIVGLHADAAGNAYVVGTTRSTDFPVTAGAYLTTPGARLYHPFVSKFSPNGATLTYSTLLPEGVALGGALLTTGEMLVGGLTFDSFTATPGAISRSGDSGFLLKLNSAGSALAYRAKVGSYGGLIGCANRCGMRMAADATGAAYISGSSSGSPTANAFQTSIGQAGQIMKIAPAGNAVLYATYFGGPDVALEAMTTDATGNLYLVGQSAAGHIPTTAGSSQMAAVLHSTDAFVAKIVDSNISCTFTVSPSTVNVPSDGGAAVVNVVAPAGCAWSISSIFPTSDDWVFATGTSTGIGSGTASVVVARNNGATARSRSFKVANQTVNLNQAGAPCTYRAAQPVIILPAGPFNPTFEATRTAGCAWPAITVRPPWVTHAAGADAGNYVHMIVEPNLGQTRRGTLELAGQTLTIIQLGPSCSFNITGVPSTVSSQGSTGSINLTAGAADCPWTASSDERWAQVYPLNGPATAPISFTIFPNYAAFDRSTILRIAGQEFPVRQQRASGTADQRFVSQMYFNFFGRLPSPSEVQFHVSSLSSISRSTMISNFLNSAEFNNGGRFIAGLYVGLLDRNAEYSGWLFQRNAMATGIVNPNQLVQNFIDSAEWKLKFGSPSDQDFVRLLYRYILLREASPGEVNFQAGALAGGLTRVQLAANFLNSNEFRTGTGPRLTAFLMYALLPQRDPTVAEMGLRTAQITAATPVKAIIEQIIASFEFAYLR